MEKKILACSYGRMALKDLLILDEAFGELGKSLADAIQDLAEASMYEELEPRKRTPKEIKKEIKHAERNGNYMRVKQLRQELSEATK